VIQLPNARHAIVPEAKIVGYLLSSTHTYGRAKAAFFESFGFSSTDWQVLRQALLDHAESGAIVKTEETAFGRKFIVEGPLGTPDGRNPTVRAVWFVEIGESQPRFVTAYPVSGGAR
jgi:hypothetical protein